MSEHDEAGSAWAFPPPLPPPPPPQPAARSASTAVRPISAASNGLLLTLPPSVANTGHHAAGPGEGPRREGASIQAFQRLMQPLTGATVASRAEVGELADAPDSKSGGGNLVWVRVPPSALRLASGQPASSP